MNAPIRRRSVLLIGLGAMAMPFVARAGAGPAIELDGDLRQGGLIRARTEPGAQITLDGKPVRVSASGRFVFGFGRDTAGPLKLVATDADGTAERVLEIAVREYRIQRIDNLDQSRVTPPDDVVERIQREAALVRAAREFDTEREWFAEGFDWPVTGPITGVYGSQRILNGEPRQPHFGVDIAATEGTRIGAPAPGIVRLAEPDLYFTGGTVILDHGHGVSTAYLHLSRVDVALGQDLARGEPVGAVGKTGRATGPHLCWRLNWFQERLDPALVVPPMPG